MTVLVTGATGFVGGAIVAALARGGAKTRAMVRDPGRYRAPDGVDVAVADLCDADAVTAAVAGVDTVIHAAALLGEFGRRSTFVDVNVNGTRRLAAAARAAGARRFVFVGSPSGLMSPDGGDQLDIDETVPYPTRFLNLYCETKAAAEQLVLAADEPEFTTCALRPRAVWGPGDRSGPVVQILAKLRAGRLPDLSDGRTVTASLCYIDHLVDAAIRATTAESVGGRSYFVADAVPVSVWPTLAELARRFDLEPPARRLSPAALRTLLAVVEALWRVPALSGRVAPPLSRYAVALVTRSATYDTTRAARDLGYRPTVAFADGVDRFHRWVTELGGLDALLAGTR